MSGSALVLTLQILVVAGAVLTALKLWRTGLGRRYPVFFSYLLFRSANGTWGLFVDVKSDIYFVAWFFTEPVNLVFYVWIVIELCGLVLRKHRGILTLGKWAIGAGLTISIAVSVLSMLLRVKPAQRSAGMFYMMAADRGVTLAMALFLLLMMLLLRGYPVQLSRNVVLHATLYSVFFISNTASTLLASVLGLHLYSAMDTGLLAVSALCLLTWLFFLNPAGEEDKVMVSHFRPEYEERVLQQLEALNATMLKISQK
jgi:hypothetical protein